MTPFKRLVPLEEYMEAAAELMDRDPTLSGAIFFSTDNQTLIDDIEGGRVHGYNNKTFTFYYTTCVRDCAHFMQACVATLHVSPGRPSPSDAHDRPSLPLSSPPDTSAGATRVAPWKLPGAWEGVTSAASP